MEDMSQEVDCYKPVTVFQTILHSFRWVFLVFLTSKGLKHETSIHSMALLAYQSQ